MQTIGKYLLGFTCLSVSFILLCALFLFAPFTESKAVDASIEKQDRMTIVVDAGHGGEDGGCVSADGILEKDLNLAISDKIEAILKASGYDVLMTRSDDRMVYDMYDDLEDYSGKKKLYDLKNRVKFTKESCADVFLSIHMNKFPVEKYRGLQVYYSKNNDSSQILADAVKKSNASYLQKDNTREIKASGSNIFVLHRLEIPAVLVECGFLSNSEEVKLLVDNEYQNKMSLVIACAVMSYNES